MVEKHRRARSKNVSEISSNFRKKPLAHLRTISSSRSKPYQRFDHRPPIKQAEARLFRNVQPFNPARSSFTRLVINKSATRGGGLENCCAPPEAADSISRISSPGSRNYRTVYTFHAVSWLITLNKPRSK